LSRQATNTKAGSADIISDHLKFIFFILLCQQLISIFNNQHSILIF